jgi:hypothetical protein
MALVKCAECGAQVSEQATACPHCGAPRAAEAPKKKQVGCLTSLAAIAGVLIVISWITSTVEDAKTRRSAEAAREAVQDRAEKVRAEFSANKAAILSELRAAIDRGEYAQAIAKAETYSGVSDPDLKAVTHEAREGKLLADLKGVAKDDLKERQRIYSELARLAPSKADYAQQRDTAAKALADAEAKRAAKLAAKRKAALAALTSKKDKVEGVTWYRDPSSPGYVNYNGFFLYIGQKAGGRPWLRMSVQYNADDWLFIESFVVNVDGTLHEGSGSKFEWERDSSTEIWEWLDKTPTESDLRMIRAIIDSKQATLRLNGAQYRKDRTITAAQKRAFARVLLAYEALGGT